MTDWVYDRREFPQDTTPVDGKPSPFTLILRWGPWVVRALDLMDGDGAFALSFAEREAAPAYDMGVLRVVRTQWNKRVSQRNMAPKGVQAR